MRISDWSSDVCSSDLLGANDSRLACRQQNADAADCEAAEQGASDPESLRARKFRHLYRPVQCSGFVGLPMSGRRQRHATFVVDWFALKVWKGRRSTIKKESRVGKECDSTIKLR